MSMLDYFEGLNRIEEARGAEVRILDEQYLPLPKLRIASYFGVAWVDNQGDPYLVVKNIGVRSGRLFRQYLLNEALEIARYIRSSLARGRAGQADRSIEDLLETPQQEIVSAIPKTDLTYGLRLKWVLRDEQLRLRLWSLDPGEAAWSDDFSLYWTCSDAEATQKFITETVGD